MWWSRIIGPPKRRVRASQGFRSFHSAWRTIQGIETVHMIRKGQIRWLQKGDILGQVAFIAALFGIAIAA
jgi:transposase, IS6 family